jgi:tRNA (cmo5U34)-methyltransferase
MEPHMTTSRSQSLSSADQKSSNEEIQKRFGAEAQLYTNLETGQVSVMDSPLCLSLVTEAASAATPGARDLLELGCGGGNYSLKLLQQMPNLNVTLVDLTQTMLDLALPRIEPATSGNVTTLLADVRDAELGEGRYDIVLASAVLHHLREDHEWISVFRKVFHSLRPGGSFWIYDIVESPRSELQAIHWRRFGDYLTSVGGDAYREDLFGRIRIEDTPRSVPWQLELLKAVGFSEVELLHKNSCFAAFGAVRS